VIARCHVGACSLAPGTNVPQGVVQASRTRDASAGEGSGVISDPRRCDSPSRVKAHDC
jgi:hypothetical protein